MDRDSWRRWRDHPLRGLLRRAESGDVVHADEIDDLGLPERVHTAVTQAIERVRASSPTERGYGGLVDHLGPAIADALAHDHPDWETVAQRRERRAALGDPAAIRDLEATQRRTNLLADSILKGAL